MASHVNASTFIWKKNKSINGYITVLYINCFDMSSDPLIWKEEGLKEDWQQMMNRAKFRKAHFYGIQSGKNVGNSLCLMITRIKCGKKKKTN